ncbi:MAG: hypothetical protein CL843_09480 [Crocinitomicaceae bacterium]|nr:hypothetical protein [Crocinitomicaceae bacterium]|tara:strand:- start:618 stop:932 length:315 start_codon:yes stop_codon:yes gene_type:complete
MSVKVRQHELYYDAELIQLPDGEFILERVPIEYENSINDRYHSVKIEDSLDHISWSYYKELVDKSEYYWWVIAEVNDIENPFDLTDYIGQKILIPDILKIIIQR